MDRDEVRLVQEALAGQSEAFDQLLAPYLPRAYRTACGITRHPETAADALQEALLRVYRALRNLRSGAPFYPWFIRIVVNEALKQAGRRAPSLTAAPEVAPSVEAHVLGLEERAALWDSIQALSPAHRAVIILRYYEELSEAEMAEVLDVSPGTVKSRLFHARKLLARRLEGARPGWRPAEGGATHD